MTSLSDNTPMTLEFSGPEAAAAQKALEAYNDAGHALMLDPSSELRTLIGDITYIRDRIFRAYVNGDMKTIVTLRQEELEWGHKINAAIREQMKARQEIYAQEPTPRGEGTH